MMSENTKVILSGIGIVVSLLAGFMPQLETLERKLTPYQEKMKDYEQKPIKLSGWYDTLDEKSKVGLEKGPVLSFVSAMFKVPHIWSDFDLKKAFSFEEGVPSPRFSSVAIKKSKALNLERAGKNVDYTARLMNSKIEKAIQNWRTEIDKLPAPIQEKTSLVWPYLLFALAVIGLYTLSVVKTLGKGVLVTCCSVGAWYLLSLVSLTLGRHETLAQIPFSYVPIAAVLGILIYKLPIPLYSNFFLKLGVILLGIQWGVHQIPIENEALEIVLFQGAFGSILTGIASWVLVFGSVSLAKRLIKLVVPSPA